MVNQQNPELRNQIVELYQSGMESSQIAILVGRTPATIVYHLRQAGVQARRKRNIWPVEQMRQWYEVDGMTYEEIGQKLGKPTQLVGKCCRKHKFQTRRTGARNGHLHHKWNGGRVIDRDGYVLVYSPEHPHAKDRRYVREHRLVMEQNLGRYLEPHEVVHHVNDDKQDNRIENLKLFQSNAEHLAETLRGKIPRWTEDGLARIRAGVEKRARQLSKKDAAE